MSPRLPDDFPLWKRYVDKKLRELFTMAASRPPLNRVASGDFTVEGGGSVRVKDGGDVVVDPDGEVKSSDFAAGARGWRLTDANAEFNDITLRGGIIGNEALANPVRGDVMMANATGFAVPRTFTTLASQTWPVPAGFTRVAVSVLGKVFAYNPTAGLDYLYARTRIVRLSDGADIAGNATPMAASGSNGSATSIAPGVGVIVFPPGDSLRLEVQAMTAFAAWAANAGNGAEIAGSLTWYR